MDSRNVSERNEEEKNEPQSDVGEIVGCTADPNMIWRTYCVDCEGNKKAKELCPKCDEEGHLSEYTPIRETIKERIIRRVRWLKIWVLDKIRGG